MTSKSHDRPIQEVLLYAFRVQISHSHFALKPKLKEMLFVTWLYHIADTPVLLQDAFVSFWVITTCLYQHQTSQLLIIWWFFCFRVLSNEPTNVSAPDEMVPQQVSFQHLWFNCLVNHQKMQFSKPQCDSFRNVCIINTQRAMCLKERRKVLTIEKKC